MEMVRQGFVEGAGDRIDARRELETAPQGHEAVAALLAQAETQLLAPHVEMEECPRPPSFLGRAVHEDLARPFDAGPSQGFAQDRFLERELAGIVELLVGAAAAAMEEGARGRAPARRRLEHFLEAGAGIATRHRLYTDSKALTGQPAWNEDDLAVVPREAEASIDPLLDGDFDSLAWEEGLH
jgi:hypothetical protein